MLRVSFFTLSMILGTLAVAIVAILVWVWVERRKRDQALREHGRPLLLIQSDGALDVPRVTAPALMRDVQAVRRSPITALAVADRLPDAEFQVVDQSPEQALVTMTTGETQTGGDAVGEMIQGAALRFHRPVDGSRPYLPGVLRVYEGPDTGLELRFVRPSGVETPVVTFGRSEGPPFRHVQLLEPTVSRAHARLSYEDDGWFLTNLSRTNPVVLNRIALTDEQAVRLHDGDRLEMGALVFRYLSR